MVETGRRVPGTISGESLRVRENMMMSHPAPQRESPSLQPWKIIRKVISFQEPKRA